MRNYKNSLRAALTLIASLAPFYAFAFDELSPAQSWIYDRSHLANTDDGQSLKYGYTSIDGDSAVINDTASMSIIASHEDGRRDVEVEFLSEQRKLALPVFKAYRGNPIIIAMLEHVAQSMSVQTGGGTLYFRNRIRDALASKDVEVAQGVATYQSKEVEATALTFYPFRDDQYLGTNPYLKKTRFSIQLSDEIPGGLVSVEVSAQDGDNTFERNLLLQ